MRLEYVVVVAVKMDEPQRRQIAYLIFTNLYVVLQLYEWQCLVSRPGDSQAVTKQIPKLISVRNILKSYEKPERNIKIIQSIYQDSQSAV
jgi:hypothetical protein